MENTNDTPFGIYILRIFTLFGICSSLSTLAMTARLFDLPNFDMTRFSLHLLGEFIELVLTIVAIVAIFSKEKWAWIYLIGVSISQALAALIAMAVILPTKGFPEFILFFTVIGLVIRILTLGYFTFEHVAAHFRVFEITKEVKIHTAVSSFALIGIYAFTFLLGIL